MMIKAILKFKHLVYRSLGDRYYIISLDLPVTLHQFWKANRFACYCQIYHVISKLSSRLKVVRVVPIFKSDDQGWTKYLEGCRGEVSMVHDGSLCY